MNKIDKFEGVYSFLSNFYPCKVVYHGLVFPSSENAYQAAKQDPEDIDGWKQFINITAGQSKKLGRKVKRRSNFDDIKIDVMYAIISAKFTQNENLKKLLLDTGDVELTEGNWWKDVFWGVCDGIGQNHLGKLLMKLRSKFILESKLS